MSDINEFLKALESPAPEGSLCPNCRTETLVIRRVPLSGPYSGSIACTSCNFKSSVIGYLGRQIITVEPMLDPVEPTTEDD